MHTFNSSPLKHCTDVLFSLHITKSTFSHEKNGTIISIRMKYPFMLSIFIKIADLQAHNALQHDMLRACRSASQTTQVVLVYVPNLVTLSCPTFCQVHTVTLYLVNNMTTQVHYCTHAHTHSHTHSHTTHTHTRGVYVSQQTLQMIRGRLC